MSSTPNDPTGPDYGRGQPPQGQPPPLPPYEPPPPLPPYEPPPAQPPHGQPPYGQPQYGQPSYGQHPPPGQTGGRGQFPDQPAYGSAPQPGEDVWQQPQDGQVPAWQASYGRGGFGPQWRTAGRGARIGAYLIDALILTVASSVVLFPLGLLAAPSSTTPGASGQVDGPGIAAVLLVWVVLPLAGYAYFGYFGGVRGATPGQRAVNLKVIGDSTGEPIGFWWYVWRHLVLNVTGSLCFLGYLSILFDSSGKDRGWHDLAARSRVVRA